MASNDQTENTLHNNGLVHDAQGRWWEMLSPTQVLTQEQQLQVQIGQNKKKCHGNRKLQRFKRKCRTHGLTEEQITMQIQNQNHTISEQLQTDQAIPEQTQRANKRKRDDQAIENSLQSSMKSLSQLSISQENRRKKSKYHIDQNVSTTNQVNHQTNFQNSILYKPCKYLKMPRKLLLQSVRLQLYFRLKKKSEQNFILSRLTKMDQQFCLEQIRYLYQIYYDKGSHHQIWPVS